MYVERHIVAAASDSDYTPGSERVAHTQLIPNVRVIDGEISDHQVGKQQLLKHVRTNVPRSHFLVRAEDFKSGGFKRRFDKDPVHFVKINFFLGTVRHHNESMICHKCLALARCFNFSRDELHGRTAFVVLHPEMNLVA